MKSAALQFVYDQYIKGDPEREASFENEVLNAKIARALYDLRTKAGLSQRQLAKLARRACPGRRKRGQLVAPPVLVNL